MFYRMNPHLDDHDNPNRVGMFELAKIAGTEVISGERWGNDFIRAPISLEDCTALEEIMKEAGVFFEKVDKLPFNLKWAE